MGKQVKKFLYIPLVIALGAWSWLKYALGNSQGAAMVANAWGWLAPEMDVHWDRLFNPGPNDPWVERVKNIGSEWARLDAQRAYKASSLIYLETFALGLGLGTLIGLAI